MDLNVQWIHDITTSAEKGWRAQERKQEYVLELRRLFLSRVHFLFAQIKRDLNSSVVALRGLVNEAEVEVRCSDRTWRVEHRGLNVGVRVDQHLQQLIVTRGADDEVLARYGVEHDGSRMLILSDGGSHVPVERFPELVLCGFVKAAIAAAGS